MGALETLLFALSFHNFKKTSFYSVIYYMCVLMLTNFF